MANLEKIYVRNGIALAHCDLRAQLTPLLGANKDIPFLLSTVNNIELDDGADSEAVMGPGQLNPIAIVPTEAKPNWSFDLSLGESRAIAKHLGKGAKRIPCNIELIWSRPGQEDLIDKIEQTLVSKGLLGKSSTSSAPNDTIGGNAVNIKPSGIDLYARVE